MKHIIIASLTSILFLTSCDRASYETEPVMISTPLGPVTCQLYTIDYIMWDEALRYVSSMKKETADLYCKDEGQRRLKIKRGEIPDDQAEVG